MAGLTKRNIDAAIREAMRSGKEPPRLWHDDPRGLHVRIKPSGAATFFIQYESPTTGKKMRHKLGAYGHLTLDQAIDAARREYGKIVDGADPALERRRARDEAKAKVRTVTEFCDVYMEDAEAGLVTYRGRPKKASTLAIDRGRVDRHIKPVLGEKLIQEITGSDVERFYHAVRRGETAATIKTRKRGLARVTGGTDTAKRTVDLLGSIFSYAVKLNLRPDNPTSRFERPPSRQRDRALTPEEYGKLGEALDALEEVGKSPVAIAAVRALALTGCRRSEILTLRCDQVDTHRQVLRLADTKTGPQLRPIGNAAIEMLKLVQCDLERLRKREIAGNVEVSPYLFPAARGQGPLVGVKLFREAIERAALDGVSLHTLRHSYSSMAHELGYSELTIAGLLGHRLHSVTSRYTHLVDRSLVSAADRVAASISDAMARKRSTAEIVRLHESA